MLELNLKNRAAAQTTIPFNSMCRFGEAYLGCTDTGISRLCGYRDNDAQIPALIRSGMLDMGTERLKRFRFFYFGVETTGQLRLTVFCDGNEAGSYIVDPDAGGVREIRVPISRAHFGRYWQWQVENISGSFFALYSVRALPVIL